MVVLDLVWTMLDDSNPAFGNGKEAFEIDVNMSGTVFNSL